MLSPVLLKAASVLLAGASIAVSTSTQAESQEPSNGRGLIKRGPSADAKPQAPLLTFNLVALDASGGTIGELRATDLRIYDDGKLMHAAFCRPVDTAAPSAPLGRREYSNRPIRGSPQATLLLFDLLNTNNANVTESGLGWGEISQSLGKIKSDQGVYVYVLTNAGTLYPVHPLPAAGNASTPSETDWVANAPTLLDQAMHSVSRLRPQEFRLDPDARVKRSLSFLKDVASDLGAQPGRKSLVWVSHGVPIDARSREGVSNDYTPLVQDVGTERARAGITLYAVDRGLRSMDTLEELVALTGGQWLPNDAVERAIETALADGSSTYRVGYVPPLQRWNNKFHKLRITVDAKGKRLRLRAPTGYFGDAREADPRDLAVFGQADASAIGIRAVVTPSERVPGWIHLQVRVDAADLQLMTSGATSTGELRVQFAYHTTEWESDTSTGTLKQLHFSQSERDAVLRDGVDMSFDRPVSSDVHKMRIVVSDSQSGAVGSLTVPVFSPSQQ